MNKNQESPDGVKVTHKRALGQENWIMKNIVSIVANGLTLLALIVTISIWGASMDGRSKANEKVLIDHEVRLRAEEISRAATMVRLDFISAQIEALRIEMKEHND